MRSAASLLLVSVFMASAANAGDWGRMTDATCNTTRSTNSVTPGQTLCYDPATNSDDTEILSVGQCTSFDIQNFDDKDGDATLCTVAWQLQHCPVPHGELTGAAEDAACFNAPGVGALNGNAVDSNLAGVFVRFTGDAAGSNATDCRILLKCSERAN